MILTESSSRTGSDNLVRIVAAILLAGGIAILTMLPASAAGPTCSDVEFLGVDNHGHHIVRDYVVGGDQEWPPSGGVGEEIAGDGAAAPGAPGIHQHGGGEFQPGASFCNEQANSPAGQDIPRGSN